MCAWLQYFVSDLFHPTSNPLVFSDQGLRGFVKDLCIFELLAHANEVSC